MASPPSAGRVFLVVLLLLPVGAAGVDGVVGAIGSFGVEYETEQVDDTATAEQALNLAPNVLSCPASRACELERRVLENGSVRYDGHIADDQRYAAVLIDGSVYVPEHETRNGSVVLTLRNVSPQEAAAAAAVPAAELGSEVQAGIDDGSVRVTDRHIDTFERNVIVSREGNLYWSDAMSSRSSPVDWARMGRGALALAVAIFLLSDVVRGIEALRADE